MRVAYVGLGAMGRALAGHLVGRFPLIVRDLDPEAVQALVDRGALAASAARDLAAEADIVILCLPRSSDVETVLFGVDGLAEVLAAGTIVIDQSSGSPSETRRFADRLSARGVAMLDAPVAGGVPLALAGGVTIMASGPAAAFEAARPVLETISPKVFHCSGRVGDGQAVKMLNNIINAANRIATLETVALGREMGLSMAGLAQALNDSPARSFITDRLLPAIVEGRSSTDFSLALMVKDLNQAGALAIEFDAPTPLSSLARGVIQTASNTLGPGARLDDVVAFMERSAGTRFRDDPDPARGIGLAIPDGSSELDDLIVGLSACERLVVLENAALAVKAGLGIEDLTRVLNSGSAWSGASLDVLPSLTSGAPTTTATLGATVATLRRLAGRAAAAHVPLLMINAARAAYEGFAHRLGEHARLDAIAPLFDEAAGVVLRPPEPSISRFG